MLLDHFEQKMSYFGFITKIFNVLSNSNMKSKVKTENIMIY